ncbi:Dabb family protein [bacterium]|nr:Dabb family protein [bacterium]
MFAHMVYFTLNEPTQANKDALVAACNKYLTGHEGTVFYAAGTRAEDADREVNDKGFDVALQMVFDSRAAQDKYQTHPRHLQFIEAAKPLYKSVRVFDANVSSP